MIEISNLSKKYGNKLALDNISLNIEKGMYGLLGPNGAGKTTLMRILATLLNADNGIVKLNGIDIKDKTNVRRIIGYLPQDFSMYPFMTVYESIDYLAILSGITDNKLRRGLILETLERVNLKQFMKTKVRALSGGMKRRLGIAQAIIHNPVILIVDEPTAGLDPEERVRFRGLLSDFSENRIVILSTHITSDVEFTCPRIGILKKGQVLFNDSSEQLIKDTQGSVWTVLVSMDVYDKLKKDYIITSTLAEDKQIRVKLISSVKPIEEAQSITPTIEDAYMNYVREVI